MGAWNAARGKVNLWRRRSATCWSRGIVRVLVQVRLLVGVLRLLVQLLVVRSFALRVLQEETESQMLGMSRKWRAEAPRTHLELCGRLDWGSGAGTGSVGGGRRPLRFPPRLLLLLLLLGVAARPLLLGPPLVLLLLLLGDVLEASLDASRVAARCSATQRSKVREVHMKKRPHTLTRPTWALPKINTCDVTNKIWTEKKF